MVKEKYVFSPDVVDIKKIDKVIEKIDRYGSRDEFLRESIDLITMWWLTPKEMFVKVQEMWADYTPEMKRETKENSPEFYERMENPTGQVSKKLSYLEEFAKEVQRNRDILEKEESPICKECIPSNNPPLMNKLHTRFFPAKIVICIRKPTNQSISLTKVHQRFLKLSKKN